MESRQEGSEQSSPAFAPKDENRGGSQPFEGIRLHTRREQPKKTAPR